MIKVQVGRSEIIILLLLLLLSTVVNVNAE